MPLGQGAPPRLTSEECAEYTRAVLAATAVEEVRWRGFCELAPQPVWPSRRKRQHTISRVAVDATADSLATASDEDRLGYESVSTLSSATRNDTSSERSLFEDEDEDGTSSAAASATGDAGRLPAAPDLPIAERRLRRAVSECLGQQLTPAAALHLSEQEACRLMVDWAHRVAAMYTASGGGPAAATTEAHLAEPAAASFTDESWQAPVNNVRDAAELAHLTEALPVADMHRVLERYEARMQALLANVPSPGAPQRWCRGSRRGGDRGRRTQRRRERVSDERDRR
ncbi:hypothetical protein CDCA_CDCA03G0889 [Cyanidium caldarium]|uniref:Uncharacterized protein n=1 Tax=Cyanidium caldarium TaxID=2771 RepID=A0AAV9IRI0_CYACA|nr:hypothetical protein CDCA_CDCA03G0889 [Cyanidium caldarium]